ncbi:MAG: hypothetical protein ABI824_17755 [Acidobacteriota bacterium]
MTATQARRQISTVLARVAAGEEIGVTRYGKLVARFTPESADSSTGQHTRQASSPRRDRN